MRVGGDDFVLTVPWRSTERITSTSEELEKLRSAGELGTYDQECKRVLKGLRAQALQDHAMVPWNGSVLHAQFSPTAQAIDDFLRSARFDDLPYPFARVRLAADILSDKRRKFADGDLADVRAASRILPYADLAIVDRNMADRIHRLRLDLRFGVTVLPASSKGLGDAATWLEQSRHISDTSPKSA